MIIGPVRLGGLIAALVVAYAGPGATQGTINTTSSSITQSFSNVRVTEFLAPIATTRFEGVLEGRGPVAALLVPDAFDSLAGRAGVASVGGAIAAAGAPFRIRLGEPTLLGTRSLGAAFQGSVVGTSSQPIGSPTTSVTTAFDPFTVPTGVRGICATPGVSGALNGSGPPGSLPGGCQFPGTPVSTGRSEVIVNTNTNTAILVRTTTTDRFAETIESSYRITGTPISQLGTSHALVVRDAYRQGEAVVRRALDERDETEWLPLNGDTGSRWRFFVEGYGGFGRSGGDPSRLIAPSRSEFGGGTAAVGFFGLPNVQLGLILDHGETSTDVRDPVAPERSTLRLTKAGPFGSFRIGDFSLGLVGVGGGGGTDTRNGSAAAGGVGAADYGVRIVTGGIDADYDFSRLFGIKIAPSVGVQWTRVETDGFTETGTPLALRGLGTDAERTRSWFGLTYRDRFRILNRNANLRVYGRYIHFSGDRDGRQEVVLASAGGTDPLTVRGPRIGASGGEWGGRLRLPVLPLVNASLSYDGTADGAGTTHVFAFRARLAF